MLNKSEKISVLMILQGDFPPDIRIEKEIKALSSQGKYEISVLCGNSKSKPRQEIFNNIIIFRLAYLKFAGKLINRLKNYPLWFHPTWILNSILLASRVKPDLIHVHDLPLMFLGIVLARIYKAKIIYDMHENYPATFDLWRQGGLFERLVRNKKLATWYDKFSIKKSDGIIVVEPEHREWIRKSYAIGRAISIVSNTVDLESYRQIPFKSELADLYKNKFILSYVGMISVERDLDVAIESIDILKNQIKDLLFIIVGDGPESDRLKLITKNYDLDNQVKFVGWVPFELTSSYIRISHICLIPQGSNDLIDNGTPHKLYQYMSMGKPVIVSDAKAMSRVIKESNCGEVFHSKVPQSLADAILSIKKNNINYGKNGLAAVKTKYNWRLSSKHLLCLYSKLSGISPDS